MSGRVAGVAVVALSVLMALGCQSNETASSDAASRAATTTPAQTHTQTPTTTATATATLTPMTPGATVSPATTPDETPEDETPTATATATATTTQPAMALTPTVYVPPASDSAVDLGGSRSEGAPEDTPTPEAPEMCDDREGGALITFVICGGERLSVWSTADIFIDESVLLLASGPDPEKPRIPMFGALYDGTDCDPQWSWHPYSEGMGYASAAIDLCDGCPSSIENDKDYWYGTVRQFCPKSAQVVAVDDRR